MASRGGRTSREGQLCGAEGSLTVRYHFPRSFTAEAVSHSPRRNRKINIKKFASRTVTVCTIFTLFVVVVVVIVVVVIVINIIAVARSVARSSGVNVVRTLSRPILGVGVWC